MQGFVDRMGAKASKATQAQDRIKKIEKLKSQVSPTDFDAAAILLPIQQGSVVNPVRPVSQHHRCFLLPLPVLPSPAR